MAVEIIHRGPDKSVAKIIVCEHCGATLRYVPTDVQKYQGRDISGGPDGCTWIVCPQCNCRVVLSSW